MNKSLPTLLIIAGSDSGGGAGIQGDIKTASAHKVFATTAITALTAQNTNGVQGIFDIPTDFIKAQIHSVLSDIGADAIKIGMLSSAEIINAVAETIPANTSLILDTVMIAKGGAALLKNDAIDALKKKLIPLAAIVTPNIPEAEVLSGMEIKNTADMEKAGKAILNLGPKAVLVKGGHMQGDEITDLLITATTTKAYKSQRIHTKNTHGTGCTLASSIACNLAKKMSLEEAVEKARKYVLQAIKFAPSIGHGHGPLNHMIDNNA